MKRTATDVFNNIDLAIDNAKEDVKKIYEKVRRCKIDNFDKVYNEVASAFKKHLSKKHMLFNKRFYSCTTSEEALKIIKSKMVVKISNVLDSRYIR